MNIERIKSHIVDDPDGRIYSIPSENDLRLWSVTTTFKALNKSAVNEFRVSRGRELANKERDEAAELGTAIHQSIRRISEGHVYSAFEWSELGIPKPEDERLRNGVRAYDLAKKRLKFTPIISELFVYSTFYGFAGTLDQLAMWNKKVVLIDFKSGDRLFPETWMQLSAYAVALLDTYNIKVDEVWRMRLGRGLPDVRSASYDQDSMDWEQSQKAFMAYLGLQTAASFLYSEGARFW